MKPATADMKAKYWNHAGRGMKTPIATDARLAEMSDTPMTLTARMCPLSRLVT
jgi:hypothetical protein